MPMGLENHNILRLKKCIYKGGKSQTSLGRINKYMCRSYSGDMLLLIWSSEKEGKAGVSKEASFSLILSHMVGTKFLRGKVYVLPPVWHATKSLYHYKNNSVKVRQMHARISAHLMQGILNIQSTGAQPEMCVSKRSHCSAEGPGGSHPGDTMSSVLFICLRKNETVTGKRKHTIPN